MTHSCFQVYKFATAKGHRGILGRHAPEWPAQRPHHMCWGPLVKKVKSLARHLQDMSFVHIFVAHSCSPSGYIIYNYFVAWFGGLEFNDNPKVFCCICVSYKKWFTLWWNAFGTSIIGLEHVVQNMQIQAWYGWCTKFAQTLVNSILNLYPPAI